MLRVELQMLLWVGAAISLIVAVSYEPSWQGPETLAPSARPTSLSQGHSRDIGRRIADPKRVVDDISLTEMRTPSRDTRHAARHLAGRTY